VSSEGFFEIVFLGQSSHNTTKKPSTPCHSATLIWRRDSKSSKIFKRC